MTKQESTKVFLSHSSKDKQFVRELDKALQAYGVETFFDERDIGIGEDIPERVFSEIRTAKHICYVISSNSINSKWVIDELSKASMLEKVKAHTFILPLVIENVDLPMAVINKRYANFTIDADKPVHERPAFPLLLKAVGITPSDFKTQQVPDATLLLDCAQTSAIVIRELTFIRRRAQQVYEEWTDRDKNLGIFNIYDRLLISFGAIPGHIERYQEALKELGPYLQGTALHENILGISTELEELLGKLRELPVAPRAQDEFSNLLKKIVFYSDVLEA